MACAYCGRRKRLAAAAAAPAAVPRKPIVGELGLAKVRYLGEGRGRIVGAVTDHWYMFAPGEAYAWVDKRDVDGLLELTWGDAPLFADATRPASEAV